MSSRVRPLGNRVLVVRDPEEGVLESGLILPDRSKVVPQRGTVVRLGQGRDTKSGAVVPFQVEVGDVVFFNRYGGIEVEVDGEKLLIISEEEILAKGEPIDAQT